MAKYNVITSQPARQRLDQVGEEIKKLQTEVTQQRAQQPSLVQQTRTQPLNVQRV